MIHDYEIINIIEDIHKIEKIAILEEMCNNTKYNLEITFSISQERRKELMLWMYIAITTDNNVVFFYPQDGDYDKAMSLLTSINIAAYNYKKNRMELLELVDEQLLKELDTIIENFKELLLLGKTEI